MRRLRRGRGLVSSLAVAGLLAFVATRGAAEDAAPTSSFDQEEPATETPDPPPPDQVPGPPPHDPFTLHPADEGALTYEDLSAEDRAAVEAAQEWAETQNGADVHNAFSAAVATTSELRRATTAQQVSGLTGHETLGVVP